MEASDCLTFPAVGNVGFGATEEELTTLFKQAGPLKSFRYPSTSLDVSLPLPLMQQINRYPHWRLLSFSKMAALQIGD